MGFTDGYKTYDPEEEGYGNPYEWKKAFRERMNPDEASQILDEDDPYVILGIKKDPGKLKIPENELKKAYRALAIQWHPDKNPDKIAEATARMQKINAAYDLLCWRFGY